MKNLFLTITLVLFVIPFGISQDLPSYIPTDGLVAYYPFNGNANDESGNDHHGVVNEATLSDGLRGKDTAYNFGSDSAYISVPSSSQLSLSNVDFTISALVKLDSYPLSQSDEDFNQYFTILGKRQYARTTRNYSIGISTPNSNIGGLKFTFAQGPRGVGSFVYSDLPIDTSGDWNNLVVVYTQNDSTIKFFVNSELVYQQDGIIIDGENDADLWFGKDVSGYANDFPGKIDDIGIWNRALIEQEIQNLFTSSSGDILLNGTVSAEDHQIKNVADPTDAQDAVTLSLLQTKLNELIERIEVLESNANYDCGLAYFEDFSSCDLNGYYAQGGNITSTNSSFDGCGVYMTHYAGQDPNNFYAVDKKFLYGVYELEAIADNGISDNIVRVLQQEELTGGYTFSFRPTSTDNPGWSVYNDGELVDSADTFPVARGAWYSIKIEVLKSSLKVWINDVVLFETDSITPPSDIPGYFKVGVAYSGGFDNLKFTPDSSVCE